MELKQLLRLLNKRKSIFWSVWSGFILLGIFLAFGIAPKNEAVLSLDISRKVNQKNIATEEYTYDQFYRLEADDKFSQTVVGWLNDPNVKRKIEKKIEGDEAAVYSKEAMESLRAEKRSFNFIQVTFSVDDQKKAVSVSRAIKSVLDEKVDLLGEGSNNDSWFRVIFNGPTLEQKELPNVIVLSLAFLLGLGMSIFSVILVEYFSKEEKENENRN